MKPTEYDGGDVLEALKVVAWPVFQKFYTLNCCIPATRNAVEVLRYFGIQSKPCPVKLVVGNEAWGRMMNDPDADLGPGWLDRNPDVWSIGIGAGKGRHDDPGWDGHLVAKVDGVQIAGRDEPHDLLVDLSLPQVNRPEHGIDFGPNTFPVPAGFPAGDHAFQHEGSGAWVVYRPDPTNRGWRQGKSLTRQSRGALKTVNGLLIRMTKALLDDGVVHLNDQELRVPVDMAPGKE